MSELKLRTLAENMAQVRERIARAAERAGQDPGQVTIVAITKTFPPELIAQAHTSGLRHFGENKVQEAQAKIPQLAHLTPRPTWHLVGHLQTNKVKAALELFDIIHSVDSLHLAQALSQHLERPFPVLLEVNVAGETTKGGFSLEEAPAAAEAIARLPYLEVVGLMTVAP